MKRGEKFREYREGAGMTQAEMADALGYAGNVHQRGSAISQKEIGARTVSERDMLAARCLWLEATYELN